jgi:ParB-like chromosome segregation protein Spo0J
MNHYPVHPLASIFPLMPDDSLEMLAESIKQTGLIHPIVLGKWEDSDGKTVEGIIDGRNRIKACELVGVEPKYTKLDGQDARAFIAASNLHRRDLTTGQKAMALAMLYPNPERGRGKIDEAQKGAATAHFSYRRLKEARQILRSVPTLAESVLSGAISLDIALAECAKRNKADTKPVDEIALLRARYSDLADRVVEGELTLEQAQTEADDRDLLEKNKRETYIRYADAVYKALPAFDNSDFVEGFRERLTDNTFREAILQRLLIDKKSKQLQSELSNGATALIALLIELTNPVRR